MSKNEQQHLWRLAARYSTVGIEMTVAVTLGTLGGHWLDHRLGTAPWFLGFGLLVGIGAAIRTILRIVRQTK